jgi:hypothetical protein
MITNAQPLGPFALLVLIIHGISACSMAAAAPFSTVTTSTTTTMTPSSWPFAGLPDPPAVGPPRTSTSLTLTTTTITMPSSTATSFTTVTASVPTGSTVPEYGQCGGLGYAGPTTCGSPFVCVCTSAWWCQCQAATAAKDLEVEDGIAGYL